MSEVFCRSESFIERQWVADARESFIPAYSGPEFTHTRPSAPAMATMFRTIDPDLCGLMAMGVGGVAFPFSFGIRGKAPMMSKQLETIYTHRGHHRNESYLTKAELLRKASELLLYDDAAAHNLRMDLIELIQAIPKTNVMPEHQRVVFWFDEDGNPF